MVRQLYVLGLHEGHRGSLERIGRQQGIEIHPLLSYEQVRSASSYDVESLLEAAEEELAGRTVDGVTTYWDFPSLSLAAILAERRGLPTPGLRAMLNCEHKYWSRHTQQRVAPEDTPPFAAVDVHDPGVLDEPPLPYPFWLKPIKSYSSHLGFRVDDHGDLDHAVAVLRRRIGRLGEPFERVMGRVETPPEVAEVPGSWAIAEGIIDGEQCTLEGHVHAGQVEIHGVFDIGREGSTFTHYTYPSRLPAEVRERMRAITGDLMAATGYDHGAFNIEFFWDRDADRTWILEVNPRISQEHSHLMWWVDGSTNLEVMASTALGEPPALELREGPCPVAAKFFHRHRDDAIVERVPDAHELERLQQAHDPCVIEVLVEAGDRLSELEDQESYSYELAYLYLAARDHDQLWAKRDAVTAELGIGLAHVEQPR